MKKIKVLQFPIANAAGGITQYALQNWKFINKDKYQFDFATLSKELDFEQELIDQGCKVHYIKCYAEDNREAFNAQINRILDEGYDVVHLHTSYWKSFEVEKIARERKVPRVIVHAHSTMIDIVDDEKRQQALLQHELMKEQFNMDMATHFSACSELAAQWLFGNKIAHNHITILKNAVDVQKYSYNEEIRQQYRQQLGIEDCFVIGHIGRFVYQKNHEMLIAIFKEIYTKDKNTRLLLVGAGILENEIKKMVNDNGLEDAVIFMGKRNDISSLLQAMDLFLLPSRFEGLGIVLIEAQSAGLKCLASNNVPYEAKVTPNIEFLPDSIYIWVDRVKEIMKGYLRSKQDKRIQEAGYDIRLQIKELEKLYEGRAE